MPKFADEARFVNCILVCNRYSLCGQIFAYGYGSLYDNLDRLIQTDRYDTTSGGNLIGRSVTHYDDRGRVYQQVTYAVDPSTGTVGNALTSNAWYDASGNVIQQIGQGDGQVFTKTAYNAVGWATATYRGYNTSGTSYSQAATVANDVIVTQTELTHDEAGNIVNQATYERLHDATGTGALTYSTQPKARVSYNAAWYDGVDRPIASANYGAIASFTQPSTPPASSDTILVTLTAYDDAGRIYRRTDPKGIVTQTTYDAAGRVTQVIEDTGSLDRTTDTTYTLDNQIATLTAVNATTGNQVTTYTYGTTLAESGVARNDLLRSVAYPDSAGSSDTVRYAYNRLGQQRTITDQRGTVRTLYYDKLGRLTNDCVTTNGSGTDVAVKQIATAYEVRGMVNQVTSTDNAAQGGGTVLNQVKLDYNSFGQLIEEAQAHGGSVGGSSPKVGYGYASGASNSNQVRPTTLTYPDGRAITGGYGTAGGMNDWLNRIADLSDTSATLADYTYLGISTVVRIDYPQPAVRLDLWGGVSGIFDGFDRFNRITDQRWQNDVSGTPTDIDRYQYGYDRNSNRTWKRNVVSGSLGTPVPLDEFYTYDRLNRLNQMQRGTLTGTPPTGIAGTPTKEQDWTLDPVGNWSAFVTRTAGTIDLNQTRTSNQVNEITAIGGTPGWATPPAYDAAGNMTSFPQPATPANAFGATYDAWNRLTKVTDSANTVAEYVYDGLGRRIVKKTYTGGTLTETRHVYYTAQWQNIEERIGASTTADRQQVWGIRYVDELVCRDDATPQRLYACQDANFNLTAIVDAVGVVVERSNYTPYGVISYLAPNWSPRAVSSYGWVVGFQGLLYDPETGNWYQRARYSNPLLGRFMERDPLLGEYQDGMNLYQYVQSNPLNKLDSSGSKIIQLPTQGDEVGGGGIPSTSSTNSISNWLLGGDWAIGVECDLVGLLGIEFGAGIVWDPKNLFDSGIYISGGFGQGANVGVGIGIQHAFGGGDLEGQSTSLDLNLTKYSPTIAVASDGTISGGFSVGPGAGVSVSDINTRTARILDLIPLLPYLLGPIGCPCE